jgi:hypothetical protein
VRIEKAVPSSPSISAAVGAVAAAADDDDDALEGCQASCFPDDSKQISGTA